MLNSYSERRGSVLGKQGKMKQVRVNLAYSTWVLTLEEKMFDMENQKHRFLRQILKITLIKS